MSDVQAKIGVPIKKEELMKFMLLGLAMCSDMAMSRGLTL